MNYEEFLSLIRHLQVTFLKLAHKNKHSSIDSMCLLFSTLVIEITLSSFRFQYPICKIDLQTFPEYVII